MKIQMSGTIECSLVNGEGMRFVLFTSGCKHHCKGCHNSETWSFDYGEAKDVNDIFEQIKENVPLIKGVTYSGGDPMEQPEALIELSKRIKNELNINIWCYTGYTVEEILNGSDDNKKELLKHIDILIDGKFEEDNIENAIKFAGSANQRKIHLENGEPHHGVTSKGHINFI